MTKDLKLEQFFGKLTFQSKSYNDTFLFSTVTTAALSVYHLNNNLSKTNDWAYNWKVISILAVQNLPMKLSSVEKKNNVHYPPVTFNVPLKHFQLHKHLGLTLESKLDFHEHISLRLG